MRIKDYPAHQERNLVTKVAAQLIQGGSVLTCVQKRLQ